MKTLKEKLDLHKQAQALDNEAQEILAPYFGDNKDEFLPPLLWETYTLLRSMAEELRDKAKG